MKSQKWEKRHMSNAYANLITFLHSTLYTIQANALITPDECAILAEFQMHSEPRARQCSSAFEWRSVRGRRSSEQYTARVKCNELTWSTLVRDFDKFSHRWTWISLECFRRRYELAMTLLLASFDDRLQK